METEMYVDSRKALAWLEGDEKMLSRLRGLFAKNVPSQMAKLKEHLARGETADAERLAHTISGSTAMIGASAMSEEAKKIERFLIDGDLEGARQGTGRLEDELAKVMAELKEDQA